MTRGPKPAYVPVRTPLLRRRGLWIAIGSVLVAGLVAAVVVGLVQERNDRRAEEELERMAAAVEDYRSAVEPILASVGQAVPPSGFSGYPDLSGAIAGLEADEIAQEALDTAAAAAETVSNSARAAVGFLQEIDPAAMVRGRELGREFVLYVLNSHDGFVRAVTLYRQAAVLTTLAVEAEEGSARDDLVAAAREVHDVAVGQLTRAYEDYVQAQVMAGVFEATPAVPAPTGAAG